MARASRSTTKKAPKKTAAKKQPKSGMQTDIEGTRKTDKRIESLATEYARATGVRQEATGPEVDAKANLIVAMQKANIVEYRMADGRLVQLKPESFKVSIKKAPEMKE